MSLKKRIQKSSKMKNSDANGVHTDNTSGSVSAPSVCQIYPGINDGYGLRRRRTSTESIQRTRNVTCERVKTNFLYFLAVVIVALVSALCYTLILLYEDTNDVRGPDIDDLPDLNLPNEQSMWHKIGIEELRKSAIYRQNYEKAKNVILFVGDGMGVSTVTATRIYKYGEEGYLSWENFPNAGLLKVNKYSNIILICVIIFVNSC